MRKIVFAGVMVVASASMPLAQSASTTDLLVGQAGDEIVLGQAEAGAAAAGGAGGAGAAGAGAAGGAAAAGAAAGGLSAAAIAGIAVAAAAAVAVVTDDNDTSTTTE